MSQKDFEDALAEHRQSEAPSSERPNFIEPTEAALDELKPLIPQCTCDSCRESEDQSGLIDFNHVWMLHFSKGDAEHTVGDPIDDSEWAEFKWDLNHTMTMVMKAYGYNN